VQAPLEALRDRWLARWPDAIALWSRFTQLGTPHWCFDEKDEKRESLSSSFAMIRLTDHAVVISLPQIAENGLEDFPLEVMGHEIGHHVYCPADLADQARLMARVRRALPTKEDQAPLICNLYADLLINDRLQRQASLHMSDVYRHLGSGSTDRMWTFYMRIYEILWSLPRASLATGTIDKALDGDAALGARVLRVYAKDWLKGSGRFAALCFPYLEENDGEGVKKALRGWLDTASTPVGEIPDGLTELDDDEIDGAMHPALDPAVTGLDPKERGEMGKAMTGDTVPRKRYRDPGEYREILKSVGVDIPDDDLTIRYYRERAVPYLIRFPVRELPESVEPLPEGLDPWDFSESLDQLDVVESLMVSDQIIPGVTTVQRTYGTTAGSIPETQPVDLYIGVDCSGSMQNPAEQVSFPVLAGAIIALSALRAGARVMVTLSGEPGSYQSTETFTRDEHEVLKVLTGYLGTGYAFGIHRLSLTFDQRNERDRPVHVLVVTDHDIFAMLQEKRDKVDGWTAAKKAVAAARGGGTYVLHMPLGWESELTRRMNEDGWVVAGVTEWEDIVPFAREFARKKYERKRGE
jgi:hypothetical protein